MANPKKSLALDHLQHRFGEVRELKDSESLFVIGTEAARIYFRYSKVHEGGRTFFGLREVDLRQLEGHNSFLYFLRNPKVEFSRTAGSPVAAPVRWAW